MPPSPPVPPAPEDPHAGSRVARSTAEAALLRLYKDANELARTASLASEHAREEADALGKEIGRLDQDDRGVGASGRRGALVLAACGAVSGLLIGVIVGSIAAVICVASIGVALGWTMGAVLWARVVREGGDVGTIPERITALEREARDAAETLALEVVQLRAKADALRRDAERFGLEAPPTLDAVAQVITTIPRELPELRARLVRPPRRLPRGVYVIPVVSVSFAVVSGIVALRSEPEEVVVEHLPDAADAEAAEAAAAAQGAAAQAAVPAEPEAPARPAPFRSGSWSGTAGVGTATGTLTRDGSRVTGTLDITEGDRQFSCGVTGTLASSGAAALTIHDCPSSGHLKGQVDGAGAHLEGRLSHQAADGQSVEVWSLTSADPAPPAPAASPTAPAASPTAPAASPTAPAATPSAPAAGG